MTPYTEAIEREIVIGAPREIVWEVVTDPAHIGKWFSQSAALDLRPGGKGNLHFDGHGDQPITVVELSPIDAFSFRWCEPQGEDPDAGNSFLVEFHLEEKGEDTLLKLRESGFATVNWEEKRKQDYFDDHTRGWDDQVLPSLVRYAQDQTVAK